MKHRTAFIIAAALTAFVLMLAGGIAFAVTPKAVAFNPTATAAATDTPTQTNTATETLAPSPTFTRTKASLPAASILMPADASRIALRLAPQAKLQKAPELVNYRGRMAYEVLFDVGAVYVDAFSGSVLFNGINLTPTATATSDPTAPPSIGGGGGGGNHGGGGGGGGQNNPPNYPPQPPSGGGGGGGGHGGHGGHGGDDGGGHGGHD